MEGKKWKQSFYKWEGEGLKEREERGVGKKNLDILCTGTYFPKINVTITY